jgi:hypothetical protein
MKNLLLISFLFSVAISLSQSYQSAESVEYDAANDRWLVANGARMIVDDGEGNLSFFGTGNATHGTEVLGNTVFTIASNKIKGYDLTSELLVMDLQIPGVGFLNGMSNDGGNILYVTDFSVGKIFSVDVSDLANPVFVELVSSTGDTPNGILYDGLSNRLLYVTWGGNAKINAVDLGSFVITTIENTGLTNIDGIVMDTNGEFYISSWGPARITKYSNDFTANEVVVTPALNSPADIGINDAFVLGIPMGSSVIFVDVEVLGVDDVESPLNYAVSSNPINDATYIQFNLLEPTNISLELYNAHGKLISNLFEGNQVSGRHSVLLAGLNLTSGLYFSKLRTNSASFVKRLIVK